MAPTLIENATLRTVEEELQRLDAAATEPGESTLRTRVMTHLAWVPPEWEQAARQTLADLGERHPSRTILLLPDPGSPRDALDAEVSVEIIDDQHGRAIASEIVAIRLRGRRAAAPASVVQPLLVSDLPVFLRWRGPLPFGGAELEQLTGVADRLVLDSAEWPDPEAGYCSLAELFDRIAVSDIAWARLLPWRRALAALWPAIRNAHLVWVRGPHADALLLTAWLGARLRRTVSLGHEPRPDMELVEVDGRSAQAARGESGTPSELLSGELEMFGRDPIYEEAVRSFASQTSSSLPRRRGSRGRAG